MRAVSGPSCGLLGPSWAILGPSGPFWGSLAAALGLSWGPLGPSWGPLGALLGASWGPFGAIWGLLGASWGRVWAEGSKFPFGFPLWAPSWGPLGPSWGFLGPSGALLVAFLGVLGRSALLGFSWAVLCPSSGLFGPFGGDLAGLSVEVDGLNIPRGRVHDAAPVGRIQQIRLPVPEVIFSSLNGGEAC